MMRFLICIVIALCAGGCNHGTAESHSRNSASLLSYDRSHRLHTAESQQKTGPDDVALPRRYPDPGRRVRSPVDLRAIPNGWRREVANAVRRVELPPENRVFAVLEEVVYNRHRQQLIFVLYEDGPDAVHRMGTYKLDHHGNVYKLDEMADDGQDMWVPLPSESVRSTGSLSDLFSAEAADQREFVRYRSEVASRVLWGKRNGDKYERHEVKP